VAPKQQLALPPLANDAGIDVTGKQHHLRHAKLQRSPM